MTYLEGLGQVWGWGLGWRWRRVIQRCLRRVRVCTFSLEGRPRSTSGAAYMNVPAKACDDEKNSARERPMSDTLACPSAVSKMFPGFTSLHSRWMEASRHCYQQTFVTGFLQQRVPIKSGSLEGFMPS